MVSSLRNSSLKNLPENSMANQNKSVTIDNLEAAFAGESMAHIKYRYFAKLARAAGARRCSTPSATSTCCTPKTR